VELLVDQVLSSREALAPADAPPFIISLNSHG